MLHPLICIRKSRRKRDQTTLLGKDKLNTIETLISNALINSYISHDELVSVNYVLRIYYEMKEEIRNPETFVVCTT